MDPQLFASLALMISASLGTVGTAVRRQRDRAARKALDDYLDFLAADFGRAPGAPRLRHG